jgi:hypothetical protein
MPRARFILFLLLGAACASTRPARPLHDLFGVSVGMPKADVHTKLASVGTMAREERKRQEVWTLTDPRYEGAIVGYDTDGNVRFITAVARANGEGVRFADVIDLEHAQHRTAGTSHNYRWHPPGAKYAIVAIGNDAERLSYLTLTDDRDETLTGDPDD